MKKYKNYISSICNNSTKAIDAVHEVYVSFESCLESKEQNMLQTFETMFFNGINYACDNNGREMANFIHEKGLECLKNRQTTISMCIFFVMAYPSRTENLTFFSHPECT